MVPSSLEIILLPKYTHTEVGVLQDARHRESDPPRGCGSDFRALPGQRESDFFVLPDCCPKIIHSLPKDLQAPPQRAKMGAVCKLIPGGNVMKKIIAICLLLLGVIGCGLEENTKARNANTEAIKARNESNKSAADNEKTLPEDDHPAENKATSKNDLSAALSGNRLHLTINGKNFWAEFHSDGSCYRGQGAKRSPTKAQWTVRGNRVKVVERSDDDYLVFADLTASKGSEVIALNSAGRAESEGTKGIIVRVDPIPPASDTPDPREMVQGIVNALAANDYEAFTKFTCLGMKKEEFKQFMNDNGDSKVIRVWDRAKDDFQAELKTKIHEAFQEILEEAQEEGFDWSQARVIECKFSDDVKAELVSGSAELSLHLDDCFVTPQGLLMFDVPRAR